MPDIRALLAPIRHLHERIRKAVVEACERAALDDLARVVQDEEGDTIFAIDRVSEDLLVEFFAREVAPASGSSISPVPVAGSASSCQVLPPTFRLLDRSVCGCALSAGASSEFTRAPQPPQKFSSSATLAFKNSRTTSR